MLVSEMQTEIAWAAGIFDGEGSIFVSKATRPVKRGGRVSYQLVACVTMTHKETLERLASIFGNKVLLQGRRSKVWWKAAYAWRLGNPEDIRSFLTAIRPYSITKAVEIDLALEALVSWEPLTRQECRSGVSELQTSLRAGLYVDLREAKRVGV